MLELVQNQFGVVNAIIKAGGGGCEQNGAKNGLSDDSECVQQRPLPKVEVALQAGWPQARRRKNRTQPKAGSSQ